MTAIQRLLARYASKPPFIYQEISQRLVERLTFMRLTPQCVVLLGYGITALIPRLQQRYPAARLIHFDLAEVEITSLPLADSSIDLIVMNAALPWLQDPISPLREAQRVMSDNAVLLLSSFGPDTLQELRQRRGDHVSPFIDLHDVGDWLLQLDFCDPVMDMERIVLSYRELPRMITELRTVAGLRRPQGSGLVTPRRWQHWLRQWQDETSVWCSTLEVIYGYATKAPTEITIPIRAISVRRR